MLYAIDIWDYLTLFSFSGLVFIAFSCKPSFKLRYIILKHKTQMRNKILLLSCCRYHYNVADVRLGQHIQKGNEDGLFISSVASCQNLWALIMDAGTGFTAQVYELSPYFLHKVQTFESLFAAFYLWLTLYLLTNSTLCCLLSTWSC